MWFRGNRIVLAECDRCGHATTLVYRHTEGWREATGGQEVHCPRCARTARIRDPKRRRRGP